MEVRITKKAIIIWCDGNGWYGRNRDRGIPRKLLIKSARNLDQVDKEERELLKKKQHLN